MLMPSTLLENLGQVLAEQKLCIATVESATAGRLAAELALLEQSGKILKGGIVCYDAGIKTSLLNIPQEFIEKHSPESAEVTEAIARALSNKIEADLYVGITGLTTPGGSETEEKPVGTMFIHITGKLGDIPVRHVFKGSAEEIVLQTIDAVADTLLRKLEKS
jgi:nicotinamide-nucleotide amidase